MIHTYKLLVVVRMLSIAFIADPMAVMQTSGITQPRQP